ncbi:hypothetical protein [Pararobbsia alpina]|uniref:Uncharacterized protein n=1 Tax=Pararobbsia alpina TaxID=621374 RepID=A0A6S7BVT3_9BURK|nr:hypothetical protein [Pararobbsia alpina]CAB3804813.1 hypothetical protein LMG28138_05579 [Pararobbsia alpina]
MIGDKGARLAVPGVIDLSELGCDAPGVARVVLESVQDMLLKPALQIARDDYEDRRERQRQGVELAKHATLCPPLRSAMMRRWVAVSVFRPTYLPANRKTCPVQSKPGQARLSDGPAEKRHRIGQSLRHNIG